MNRASLVALCPRIRTADGNLPPAEVIGKCDGERPSHENPPTRPPHEPSSEIADTFTCLAPAKRGDFRFRLRVRQLPTRQHRQRRGRISQRDWWCWGVVSWNIRRQPDWRGRDCGGKARRRRWISRLRRNHDGWQPRRWRSLGHRWPHRARWNHGRWRCDGKRSKPRERRHAQRWRNHGAGRGLDNGWVLRLRHGRRLRFYLRSGGKNRG